MEYYSCTCTRYNIHCTSMHILKVKMLWNTCPFESILHLYKSVLLRQKVFCILCNCNRFSLLLKKTFVCFVEVAPGGSEPGLYPSVSDNNPAPIGFESHGECIQYTIFLIFSQIFICYFLIKNVITCIVYWNALIIIRKDWVI